jgi:hypothetical protein
MYNVGDIVDFRDELFGWRGRYVIVAQKTRFHLIKIKNIGTNSMQFVSPDRLRKSRLSQFFIKSLMPST